MGQYMADNYRQCQKWEIVIGQSQKKKGYAMRILKKQSVERVEELLERYPKVREPLPDAYQKIYEEHYLNNRNGQTVASFFSSKLEQWMHKKSRSRYIQKQQSFYIGNWCRYTESTKL